MRLAIIFLLSLNALAQWQTQDSHTRESLRGLSVVDEKVVWASGTHGTYLITTDGGKNWTTHQVPGAESLDFRGVRAFGVEAFLLAAGPGSQSRVYHTANFGRNWDLQFTNPEPKGFLDCMAFSDQKHGTVVGDPVGGKFQILQTDDGGKNWRFTDAKNMPPAIEGEGAFAASNSCIAVRGRDIWFVTGGAAARVFHSTDRGASWTVTETPIVHGAASQGIFSLAFTDSSHGVVAGGDYAHPDQGGNNLAVTEDGGKTWKLAPVEPQKYFSSVVYASRTGTLIVVGAVAAVSEDNLHYWKFSQPLSFNAVGTSHGVIFAVGANGSIATYHSN